MSVEKKSQSVRHRKKSSCKQLQQTHVQVAKELEYSATRTSRTVRSLGKAAVNKQRSLTLTHAHLNTTSNTNTNTNTNKGRVGTKQKSYYPKRSIIFFKRCLTLEVHKQLLPLKVFFFSETMCWSKHHFQ